MIRGGFGAIVFSLVLSAQSTPGPTFEVASVKPAAPSQTPAGRASTSGDRVTMINTTVSNVIGRAYGVKFYQIDGPPWILTERYDILAKAPDNTPKDQIPLMLQSLLAERFKLTIHRETRELPVFALVVAKGGPKFKLGDGGAMSIKPDGTGGYAYKNYSMATLADSLSLMTALGRPVLDRTGLAGGYSFNADLYNIPKGLSPAEFKEATVNSDAIFSTLPEQLGLKLESQKAPIEFLVIDHAEKVPVEN